jgi:hypothetical protein
MHPTICRQNLRAESEWGILILVAMRAQGSELLSSRGQPMAVSETRDVMKTLIAPLAALAFCAMAGAASAASPAYCALYAKEYARQAMSDSQGSLPETHVHDRAYSKCLNMDDEPPLPTAYVDPAQDGIGGPFVPVEEGSAGEVPAVVVEAPVAPRQDLEQTSWNEMAVPAAKPKRTGKWTGSGYPTGSPEWKAWCQEHFPNSFDLETGTIVPSATGVRTACK